MGWGVGAGEMGRGKGGGRREESWGKVEEEKEEEKKPLAPDNNIK